MLIKNKIINNYLESRQIGFLNTKEEKKKISLVKDDPKNIELFFLDNARFIWAQIVIFLNKHRQYQFQDCEAELFDGSYEVFLRSLERFQPERKIRFITFLASSLNFYFLQWLKQKKCKNKKEKEVSLDAPLGCAENKFNLHQILFRDEGLEPIAFCNLGKLIQKAKLEKEEILLLEKYFYQNLTLVEIGDELGVSNQAVSVKLKKIIFKLRRVV